MKKSNSKDKLYLTNREEEIMQAIWKLEKAFVNDIKAELAEDMHYNSIATIIKILQRKGFVDYKKYGNTYQYYPIISKETYQKRDVRDLLSKYFDNSYQKMVAYFAKEEKISSEELEDIVKMIKNKNDK